MMLAGSVAILRYNFIEQKNVIDNYTCKIHCCISHNADATMHGSTSTNNMQAL